MNLSNSSFDSRVLSDLLKKENLRIYFIGIGGASCSSLARLAADLGHTVMGSDVIEGVNCAALMAEGIEVVYSQNGEGIISFKPDLVVYSLAIDDKNGDYITAVALGATVISRAQLLGALLEGYSRSIAVSGSHGKTTVTHFIYQMLKEAGKDPTALIGVSDTEGGLRRGGKSFMVYESCEYKESFILTRPKIQILLNLDLDHTDYYRDLSDLQRAFLRCADNAAEFVIMPSGNANLDYVRGLTRTRVITYGTTSDADYRYEIIGEKQGRYSLRLYCYKILLGEISLSVHGVHNLENAVAASVAAIHCGVKFDSVKRAAERLTLPSRRWESLCRIENTEVVYDYAHHPREIEATLFSARQMGFSKIAVIFSPHTYSRTASLMQEFARALSSSDLAVITDIYAAREKPIEGICAQTLVDEIKRVGGNAVRLNGSLAAERVAVGFDCILLMGAGELDEVKSCFIKST